MSENLRVTSTYPVQPVRPVEPLDRNDIRDLPPGQKKPDGGSSVPVATPPAVGREISRDLKPLLDIKRPPDKPKTQGHKASSDETAEGGSEADAENLGAHAAAFQPVRERSGQSGKQSQDQSETPSASLARRSEKANFDNSAATPIVTASHVEKLAAELPARCDAARKTYGLEGMASYLKKESQDMFVAGIADISTLLHTQAALGEVGDDFAKFVQPMRRTIEALLSAMQPMFKLYGQKLRLADVKTLLVDMGARLRNEVALHAKAMPKLQNLMEESGYPLLPLVVLKQAQSFIGAADVGSTHDAGRLEQPDTSLLWLERQAAMLRIEANFSTPVEQAVTS